MRPWVRFIFVFIAYGLALLHTIVPHHHAKRGSGSSVYAHTGCAVAHENGGLLLRTLSTDLGVGHLETFNRGSDTRIEFSVPALPATFSLPLLLQPVLHAVPTLLNGHVEKLKKRLLLFSASQFRAPPVFQ